MRILITGGAGQLATDLGSAATAAGHDATAPDRFTLDITSAPSVRRAFAASQPDVVVNCAAWTAVDACEASPQRAERVNGTAVGILSEVAAETGAHLIQISTDYVFDGSKTGPYDETDIPNPQTVYGRSKLLGEEFAGPRSAVVRTSWVYSQHGGNMVATICRLAGEQHTLRFVDDQVGCPTHTADLAGAILRVADARATGVWHCTNAGAVSWFEFAQEVLRAAGHDPDRVVPVRTGDLVPPRPALRPANSVLGNGRYNSSFTPLPDFRDQLEAVVKAYL